MKNTRLIPRDVNILKGYKREISLATKVVKDKKRMYSRKTKHKGRRLGD